MKNTILGLFLLAGYHLATAQNFAGVWKGTYNDDQLTLELKSTDQKNWTGEMKDSQQKYAVVATVSDKKLTGTAKEASLGLTFKIKAVVEGAAMDLTLSVLGVEMPAAKLYRQGSEAANTTKPAASANKPKPAATTAAAMPALPANARQDPQLVGTWKREEQYSSGYGRDGGYASNTFMAFNADGTMTDLGNVTVAGGSNFSGQSQSGGAGIVPGVKWYTDGTKTETVKLGRYYIERGAMLITADNGTKVLFYKQ
jgi:hypothetical protein